MQANYIERLKGYTNMDMGMPPGVISKGMDDHYHGRYSINTVSKR